MSTLHTTLTRDGGRIRSRKRAAPSRAAARVAAGATREQDHGFSNDEWHDMVSTAAYYRAEARGFENGSADEDWFEAQAELRERFGAAAGDVEGESASGGAATDIETKGE